MITATRLLTQDIDVDALNQGLTNAQYLQLQNEAYQDMYAKLNLFRTAFLATAAVAGVGGVVTIVNSDKQSDSAAGLFEINSLELGTPTAVASATTPAQGAGTELERTEVSEILWLQKHRSKAGLPKKAGWYRKEASDLSNEASKGLWTVFWYPVLPVAATPTLVSAIASGYVKKYPAALTGTTATTDIADLDLMQTNWLVRITAARAIPLLDSGDQEFLAAIAAPLPDDMKALAMTQSRLLKPRPKPSEEAV
jgi:hypothetical protein